MLVSHLRFMQIVKRESGRVLLRQGAADKANQLYEYIIEESKKSVSVVQTGRFGAEMEVSLINDGGLRFCLIRKCCDRIIGKSNCLKFKESQ